MVTRRECSVGGRGGIERVVTTASTALTTQHTGSLLPITCKSSPSFTSPRQTQADINLPHRHFEIDQIQISGTARLLDLRPSTISSSSFVLMLYPSSPPFPISSSSSPHIPSAPTTNTLTLDKSSPIRLPPSTNRSCSKRIWEGEWITL